MKTKHFKSRHALLMSLTSLMLCVSMLFGATFAWFTDSVTSGVNRIVSGNLDVELYHNSLIAGTYETANTPVTATTSDLFHAAADETAVLWEPGAMAVEQFIVKNVGSLALKYKLSLNKVEDGFYNYVTWTDDETKYDLTDVIKVAVSDTAITARDASTLSFMNWDAFVTGGMKAGALAANDNVDGGEDEATFYVALYWAPQADNAKDNKYNLNNKADNKWTLHSTVAAEGVTGAPTLSTEELEIYPSITLLATQATSESDSFDNQYDVRADGVHTFVVAEYVPVGAVDTTVTSKNDAGGTVAEVKVPNAAYENLGIAEGDTLSLLPGEATETYDEDSVTVKGNIDLVNQNGEVINTSENTVPLQAKYFVGKNLGAGAKITLELQHTGETATIFKTASAGGSGDTLLTYDVNTGMVSFSSAKFCPVEVAFDKPEAKVGDTFYATLREALDAAASGATVVLLKDVALSSTVTIDKNLTINLNGKNIAATNARALLVRSGDLKLGGTGTVSATKSGESSFASGSSVIRVGDSFSANDVVYPAASLTIGKDVTVGSDYCYGVTAFGTNNGGQTVIVNGKIVVTGSQAALSGNGTSTLAEANFTINDGAMLSATNDYAVYHPQKGTMTVNGGTITGKGGIEAKGGTVNVLGGTIMATATKTSHETNNNGTSTSGYAIAAVENSNYKGEGNFTITGGTINGEVAVVKDIETESWEPVISITGGTFSSDVSKYCAEGMVAIENSNGTYSIGYGMIIGGKAYLMSKIMSSSLAYNNNGYLNKATITDAQDLVSLSALANDGKVAGSEDNGLTVTVANDIDMAGYVYQPPLRNMFMSFDGQNHTISNLTIGQGFSGKSGLLSYAGGSTIKDLTLKNVTASGCQAGAFVGQSEGTKLTNCTLAGDINITWAQNNTSDYVEQWNAIGAIIGWNGGVNITGMKIADNTKITLTDTGMASATSAEAKQHWNNNKLMGSNASTSGIKIGTGVTVNGQPLSVTG